MGGSTAPAHSWRGSSAPPRRPGADARPRRPRWPWVLGLVVAVLYSNFLIAWLLQGFGDSSLAVSQLEVPGQPDAAVLRLTDIASALLMLPLLVRLPGTLPVDLPARRVRSAVIALTWAFAVGALVASLVALPCGPGVSCVAPSQVLRRVVHDGSSAVSDVAAFLAMALTWAATRRRGPRWLARTTWWLFWLGGVVAGLLLGYADLRDLDLLLGLSQRAHILCIGLWICCLGLLSAGPLRRPRGGPTRPRPPDPKEGLRAHSPDRHRRPGRQPAADARDRR